MKTGRRYRRWDPVSAKWIEETGFENDISHAMYTIDGCSTLGCTLCAHVAWPGCEAGDIDYPGAGAHAGCDRLARSAAWACGRRKARGCRCCVGHALSPGTAGHDAYSRPVDGQRAFRHSALRFVHRAPHTSTQGAADESYALDVASPGVTITAGSRAGYLYGAVTLWQMMAHASGSIPAVHIEDGPRFRWRGIMLDSARHMQSEQFILQLLDYMAEHKLNVFHWHLTDDQGWRIEIKRYPRLTAVGGFRPQTMPPYQPGPGAPTGPYGGFYTQDQIRRIVAYAKERNIAVVPEIEMPGHATAALVAYPEFGSAATPLTGMPVGWGIYPNLYNTDDATFAFLENVLTEVIETCSRANTSTSAAMKRSRINGRPTRRCRPGWRRLAFTMRMACKAGSLAESKSSSTRMAADWWAGIEILEGVLANAAYVRGAKTDPRARVGAGREAGARCGAYPTRPLLQLSPERCDRRDARP